MRFDPLKDAKLLERKNRDGKSLLQLYQDELKMNPQTAVNWDLLNNNDILIHYGESTKDDEDSHRNTGKLKYRNIKEYDPETESTFDSKFELHCWRQLCNLRDQGKIEYLIRQVSYDLVVDGLLVCRIRPDFEFLFKGLTVTADAKSLGTQGSNFQIKRKLFRALFKQIGRAHV